MNKLIDSILYSNVFIALNAAAIYLYGKWSLTYGFEMHDALMAVAVFCSTIIAYNLTRKKAINDPNNRPPRSSWWSGKKNFYALMTYGSGVLLTFSFFFMQIESVMVFAGLGLLSVLYTIPIPGTSIKLRSIGPIKIFLISLIWAATAALIPLFEYSLLDLTFDFWMDKAIQLFIQQYLFILAICLPFDIRDKQRDEESGLKTIPVLIGEKNSLFLAIGLIAVATIFFALNAILAVLCIVFMSIAYSKDHDWYFLGLMDLTILIQLLLAWKA